MKADQTCDLRNNARVKQLWQVYCKLLIIMQKNGTQFKQMHRTIMFG